MSFIDEPDPDFLANLAKVDPTEVPDPSLPPPPESLEDAFPDDMNQDLTGLMWIGYLFSKFHYLGHEFRIKTLTIGEELAIAQVTKEYEATIGTEKAIAAALVAASIESVDGQPIRGALGPAAKTTIEDKFLYVIDPDEGWYWPTVEAVYHEFLKLQERQMAVYERLQSKSKASRKQS